MIEAEVKHVIEAALFAAGRPLSVEDLLSLFAGDEDPPERGGVIAAIGALEADWEGRGVELKEVASGYRFQVKAELGTWMARLWAERAPRYSRALLETLALIAYRQPITRAEIEEVRGVSVSSSIVKTLMEREWIRVLGHRDVPGRPALYGTTRDFLDSFNLTSLEDLPALSEVTDLDQVHDDLFAAVRDADGQAADDERGAEGADGESGRDGEALPPIAVAGDGQPDASEPLDAETEAHGEHVRSEQPDAETLAEQPSERDPSEVQAAAGEPAGSSRPADEHAPVEQRAAEQADAETGSEQPAEHESDGDAEAGEALVEPTPSVGEHVPQEQRAPGEQLDAETAEQRLAEPDSSSVQAGGEPHESTPSDAEGAREEALAGLAHADADAELPPVGVLDIEGEDQPAANDVGAADAEAGEVLPALDEPTGPERPRE